jgi:hypothetical protein
MKCRFILFITVIFFASGCSYNIYKPVVNEKISSNSTLAVMTGANNPIDIALAEKTTKNMENNTSFRVMNQADITKRIPQYPGNIIDFEIGKTDNFLKPWLSDQTAASVKQASDILKVNYVLLLWTENSVETAITTTSRYGSSTSYNVSTAVYARLIKFPENKVVGYSYFSWSNPGNGNKAIDEMLDQVADVIAFKIGDATGIKKTGDNK